MALGVAEEEEKEETGGGGPDSVRPVHGVHSRSTDRQLMSASPPYGIGGDQVTVTVPRRPRPLSSAAVRMMVQAREAALA